jgi:hypothetical protein
MTTELKVTLTDHGVGNSLDVKIQSDPRWIWISPEGYGDNGSEDGHGATVGLELYNGRLRLLVYSNINEQDPQIIDLQGALESNRLPESKEAMKSNKM